MKREPAPHVQPAVLYLEHVACSADDDWLIAHSKQHLSYSLPCGPRQGPIPPRDRGMEGNVRTPHVVRRVGKAGHRMQNQCFVNAIAATDRRLKVSIDDVLGWPLLVCEVKVDERVV